MLKNGTPLQLWISFNIFVNCKNRGNGSQCFHVSCFFFQLEGPNLWCNIQVWCVLNYNVCSFESIFILAFWKLFKASDAYSNMTMTITFFFQTLISYFIQKKFPSLPNSKWIYFYFWCKGYWPTSLRTYISSHILTTQVISEDLNLFQRLH